MSLETAVSANYHKLVSQSKIGPDKTASVFYEWASNRVFLDATETMNALHELGTSNYGALVQRIHEILETKAEYFEVRRLSPALGLNGGKLVIYLVLPKPSWNR